MHYLFGDCRLNTQRYVLHWAGQPVRLRPTVFRLLDELLTLFGASDEAASLAEIRAMFAAYEKPGMTTLSSEIEAMREER
jgi:DNA-binding response OmpR family regulator